MEVVEHPTLHRYIRVGGRIIPFCPFFIFPRDWSLEVDKVFFFIALFLSVLNPIDDFLCRWMTFKFFLTGGTLYIDLQRITFWVN